MFVDVRDSITQLRSGFPGNTSGPTFFLLSGKKKNPVYTDEFLERQGAKKYSTVVMTPTGYLTEEAWATIIPLHIKGVRHILTEECAKLGVDKATADKLLIGQFFDGFGIHTKTFVVLVLFAVHNFLCAVENRDSSEFAQAFDQWVAKAGKKKARDMIDMLRRSNISPIIDQWTLVNVGLSMLRDCDSSNVWEASFIAVNMHPHHRISFDDWMDKIDNFTRAGEKFDDEVIDLSSMLPKIWLQTPLPKRQEWLATIKEHNANFDVTLIAKLRTQHMPLQLASQMFKIYHCEKRIADGNFVRKFKSKVGAKKSVQTYLTPAKRGTMIYHLFKIPEAHSVTLTPFEKLEHAITVRNRTLGPAAATTVSPYLDVEVTPMNQALLELKPEDVNMYNVLQQSTCKSGSRRKIAKRTLTALGGASGMCRILNGPEQLKQLKVMLSFTPCLTLSLTRTKHIAFQQDNLKFAESIEEVRVAEKKLNQQAAAAKKQKQVAAVQKKTKSRISKTKTAAALRPRHDQDWAPIRRYSLPQTRCRFDRAPAQSDRVYPHEKEVDWKCQGHPQSHGRTTSSRPRLRCRSSGLGSTGVSHPG